MDSPFNVQTLCERLKAMPRSEVLKLAAAANVPASTVQKIRSGLIGEPGAHKVQALIDAIRANDAEAARPSKKKAAA